MRLCCFPLIRRAKFGIAFLKARQLHSHVGKLTNLLSKRETTIVTAIIRTTRGVVDPSNVLRGLVAVRVNRIVRERVLIKGLVGLKCRQISRIRQYNRFSMHKSVISVFTVGRDRPFHIRFFSSRISKVHIFGRSARHSVSVESSVSVLPTIVHKRHSSSVLSCLGDNEMFCSRPRQYRRRLGGCFRRRTRGGRGTFS